MELSNETKLLKPAETSGSGGIPDGWKSAPLKDLFSFGGGLSASRDQLSVEGLAYLHYGDIHLTSKTYIDLDKEHHLIPKLNVPLSSVNSKHLLRAGDVAFVDASEDEAGITKHVVIANSECRPFISGLHTIVSKPKNGELDNGFKRFCFQPKYVWDQFRYYAVGTKVTGISKSNIGHVVLHFPPLAEQRLIATALSDVDGLLAGLDALIAKKKAIKQGSMQRLLTGQQRLPGFEGEWVVRRLGEVANVQKGTLITESTAVAGKIPVVSAGLKPSYTHNTPNRLGTTLTVSASGAYAGYVSLHNRPIFACDCSTIGVVRRTVCGEV